MPTFDNGAAGGAIRALLNDTGLRKHNFAASALPGAGDDDADGYEVGSNGEQGPPGQKGDKGDTGDTGPGVATGGTTGQFLRKASETNYDTGWADFDAAVEGYLDGAVGELSPKSSPVGADSLLVFDSDDDDAPKTSTIGQTVGAMKLVASDPTGVSGADQITNVISLTQAEYNAIGSPSASTLYVITDA